MPALMDANVALVQMSLAEVYAEDKTKMNVFVLAA
jgi:hypothetical protein